MPERHATSPGSAPQPAAAAAPARVPVLLPLPLAGAYDYAVPGELSIAPGDIVRVPLGARETIGVVWDESGAARAEPPPAKLRPIAERFEVRPLSALDRRFVEWVAGYTLTPPGAVLRMLLRSPQALEPAKPSSGYRLSAAWQERLGEGEPSPERLSTEGLRPTPARLAVLRWAAEGMALTRRDLAHMAGVSESVVIGLTEAGVLERVVLPPPAAFEAPDPDRPAPELSPDQSAAAQQLTARVGNGFSVTLLDGVTGSGKTEVYLEAVAEALRQGRQVLVLLPEIALSAQWLERFTRRFGARPAEWHSDLASRQRRATWRGVANGEARVVVGARSALFLPYQDLGLIVIDEEHDPSFKQEDGVIYHARDMAVVRAHLGEIAAVLVSATPSLESLVNLEQGKYFGLHLPERHGGASLPEVSLIDLREDAPPPLATPGSASAMAWLSPRLRGAMEETLERGEQCLLYLNRRGYAPLTLCRNCGHRLQCLNCTAWLVDHRLAGRLVCHHCGHAMARPRRCPECDAEDSLVACGPGVERLSEEVAALFPEARTGILSSDTISGPRAAAQLVEAMQEHRLDILIGTQIVAKGHHFPLLTLVGVVDGDLGLSGGDLRAAERTWQLLHQVAGRAGRAEHKGRVLIQTHAPEQTVMSALASGDRERFLQAEAESRRQAGMPPFGRLVALILSSSDPRVLEEAGRQLARSAPRGEGVEVWGPAPAPLAMLRGRHRQRMLLKTRRDIMPQPLLRRWLSALQLPSKLRLQIDVDPMSFL